MVCNSKGEIMRKKTFVALFATVLMVGGSMLGVISQEKLYKVFTNRVHKLIPAGFPIPKYPHILVGEKFLPPVGVRARDGALTHVGLTKVPGGVTKYYRFERYPNGGVIIEMYDLPWKPNATVGEYLTQTERGRVWRTREQEAKIQDSKMINRFKAIVGK